MTLKKTSAHGFTIVELLISTVVFAVLLLVLTFAIIQVNKVYYKDITTTQTQSVARSILDSLAQDIQFGAGTVDVPNPADYQPAGGSPAGTADTTGYAICTQGGTKRYSILIGHKLEDNPSGNETKHAVVVDHPTSCTSGPAGALPMDGTGKSFDLSTAVNPKELLAPNMRVAFLTVDRPVNGIYRIQIRIAHGDDDLLMDNFRLDATNGEPQVPPTDGVLDQCNTASGSQFCSTVYLKTWVVKRVQ